MSDKLKLSYEAIVERFDSVELPDVDAIVGIQTGGRIPAALCAYRLKKPLFMLPINYRNPDNSPKFEAPKVLGDDLEIPDADLSILLVDDVSVTGSTFRTAKALLNQKDSQITTFALKGNAHICLFPEVAGCVDWPWNG